ncbi:MAG: UAA transporter [Chrysothrix sp. TS-e1954]|nr:MAG: UAA transporter [Chrysothrix sp. TS-e1954]
MTENKYNLRSRSRSPLKLQRERRNSAPKRPSTAFQSSAYSDSGTGNLSPIQASPLLTQPDTFAPQIRNRTPSPSKEKQRSPVSEKKRHFADVEAQHLPSELPANTSKTPTEYTIPTRTKFLYLAGWFALNLSLTIYNKAILHDFHYPWLLTTLHATSLSVGCFALLLRGYFTLTTLTLRDNLYLTAFSLLFTFNIALSNLSLDAVSVPFHQIARSLCPVFTILIYRLYYSRTYSTPTYLSLVPIILGIALATYGDIYFTPLGFALTLLGVLLSSLKTVVSNRLMTGSLRLPALEILLRMSPLAASQSLILSYTTGELALFHRDLLARGYLTNAKVLALAGNGALAFALNISSFATNRLAGALTLTVAGNLKQCMTILVGVAVFKVRVTGWNGLGMGVASIGAAWYSKVELDARGRR